MSDDLRATALIDEINALEARLEPRPRKGRRLGGILGVLALLAGGATFNWDVLVPIVLLVMVGNGANLLPPVLRRRYVQRQRDRLIEQHDKIIALAEQRLVTPGSTGTLDSADDETS